jgi:hypothetical protein
LFALTQVQGTTTHTLTNTRLRVYTLLVTHNDKEKPKTAMITTMGHFQWKLLCYELTNAPYIFQTVMNQTFQEHMGDLCWSIWIKFWMKLWS